MPIISENPKELYEALYNELKNKYGPVSVYLRDKDMLDQKEKAIGKAMEDFIKLYEMTEESFSVKKDMKKPKYGIVYSDADYSTVMQDLKKDEELGAKLEAAVENIRAKLLIVAEERIKPGYDYEKEKDNSDEKERFTALNFSVSDRMGAWKNEAIDKEIERRKRVDLEFAHRPEVFLRVKDPKTNKVNTVKAERYVPYKKKFSTEYRFFNRETSYIEYDRAQDPDANTVGILALRDILENHKERKEDSDRRREYVKFINRQHQAYAVWKEQMPKEKEKYDKLVATLSEETRKRYEAVMTNYNSMTSMLSGIDAWLEQEKVEYLARKKVLDDAQKASDTAYSEYESAKNPYEEYLKEMETERLKAEEELKVLRSNPLLDETYVLNQRTILENYSKAQQEIVFDLQTLEKEIQDDIAKQAEARNMLMNMTDKVKQYKEQVVKLKKFHSYDNYEAVKEYYEKLFEGEVQLTKELETQQKSLKELIDKRISYDNLMEEERVKMVQAQADLLKAKAQLRQDETRLERAKEFTHELKSADFKALQKYMQELKATLKTYNLSEDEFFEEFGRGCALYAAHQNWDIGTDLAYLDPTEAKALQARIKDNKILVEKLTKDNIEKENKYKKIVEDIEKNNASVKEEIEAAEAAIDQFTKKLDDLQGPDRDKNVNALKQSLEDETLAKVDKEDKVLAETEDSIEKSFKDLSDEIKKKMALRDKKQEELFKVEELRTQADNNLQSADNLKVHLKEQEDKYKELVEKQEQKKKQLEEAKTKAEKAWMDKEMDQDKLQQENQKFVEEYEFIQKKLEDGEGTSYRRMQDLSALVQKQQEKLTKDAEAQKKYIQKNQNYLCEKLRKQLVGFKLRLLAVAEPSGRFKSSNSKEFTEFKHTSLQYLDTTLNGDNPLCILDKLEEISGGYCDNDEDRVMIMKEVCSALDILAMDSDNYLKAKGDPRRVTELGRARYALAGDFVTLCKDASKKLKGMILEEECCKIAPDLSKATSKSGLDVGFDRTVGYKYSSEAINKESDIFSPDAFREKKEPDAPAATVVKNV